MGVVGDNFVPMNLGIRWDLSIVPDGYSSVIYDQDNQAGNSVCLSGSALDLSQLAAGLGEQ